LALIKSPPLILFMENPTTCQSGPRPGGRLQKCPFSTSLNSGSSSTAGRLSPRTAGMKATAIEWIPLHWAAPAGPIRSTSERAVPLVFHHPLSPTRPRVLSSGDLKIHSISPPGTSPWFWCENRYKRSFTFPGQFHVAISKTFLASRASKNKTRKPFPCSPGGAVTSVVSSHIFIFPIKVFRQTNCILLLE